MATTATASIYDTITNQIIAALERGTGDYTLPWHRSSAPLTRPVNAVTRKAYRGVNVLALWASAEAQDFGHGLWATYRQWQSLGAQVRKGEKASPIVFYKVLDKAEDSEVEAREGAGRIFAQGSHVFNIAQVEGYALPEVPEAEAFDPIPDVEAFIAATGATIRIQGDSAHYTPSTDTITMPDPRFIQGTDRQLLDGQTRFQYKVGVDGELRGTRERGVECGHVAIDRLRQRLLPIETPGQGIPGVDPDDHGIRQPRFAGSDYPGHRLVADQQGHAKARRSAGPAQC